MARSAFDIWLELQSLALRVQREEHAKLYILRRMWLVIPLGIAFFAASAMGSVGVFKFVTAAVPGSMPGWLVCGAVALVLAVFFGAAISQIYVLVTWLERAASRRHSTPSSGAFGAQEAAEPRRGSAPFVLITAFVVVPLVMYGSAFPSSAFMLGAAGLVAVLFYMTAT